MNIHWYGHSCFLFTTANGTRIITDPFESGIGYTLTGAEADIVTISHNHYDHNHAAAVQGAPVILNTQGEHTVLDICITGIRSFHDAQQGALRGENLIFVYEIDGMRIAHLGDIGDMPSKEAFAQLGKINVLLAPVGGIYTIDPRTACDIANIVQAEVLIPMHYQTPKLKLRETILGVDTLLSIAKDCRIHRLNQSHCNITQENLGIDRLLVLTPSME